MEWGRALSSLCPSLWSEKVKQHKRRRRREKDTPFSGYNTLTSLSLLSSLQSTVIGQLKPVEPVATVTYFSLPLVGYELSLELQNNFFLSFFKINYNFLNLKKKKEQII